MKKAIVLLLTVLLCTTLFAGCATAQIDEAVVGTWNMQLDLAAPMVELLKENKLDALLQELDLSATKVDITISLQADGAYTADVDVGAIEKLSAATAKAVAAVPELEKKLKEVGVDISAVTNLLNTLFPKKENEEQKATVSGKFKTEEGKLFLGLGKTITLYADGCTYTVEGDTLTISAIDGSMGQTLENVLPMEFKKA